MRCQLKLIFLMKLTGIQSISTFLMKVFQLFDYDSRLSNQLVNLLTTNSLKRNHMKNLIYSIPFILLFPLFNHAQTYYPLPEENAFWTVVEFDWDTWENNDIVYTVNGDTIINNLTYKKIYRLDDYPGIYDTISTLHCFMRQNAEEKKIWFIRHYLYETEEKLGYDLSVKVGDTVSLPAFDYLNTGDSQFTLVNLDSVDMELWGETTGIRKRYGFANISINGQYLDYTEGVLESNSTFPNLDNYHGFDPFHQSLTVCLLVNNIYWVASQPFYENCGFLVLDSENYDLKNALIFFPNPARDLITVQLPDSFISPGILTIYNNFGAPVLRREFSGLDKSLAIDVSNFINGIYFLSINSNSTNISTKLIVKP